MSLNKFCGYPEHNAIKNFTQLRSIMREKEMLKRQIYELQVMNVDCRALLLQLQVALFQKD